MRHGLSKSGFCPYRACMNKIWTVRRATEGFADADREFGGDRKPPCGAEHLFASKFYFPTSQQPIQILIPSTQITCPQLLKQVPWLKSGTMIESITHHGSLPHPTRTEKQQRSSFRFSAAFYPHVSQLNCLLGWAKASHLIQARQSAPSEFLCRLKFTVLIS